MTGYDHYVNPRQCVLQKLRNGVVNLGRCDSVKVVENEICVFGDRAQMLNKVRKYLRTLKPPLAVKPRPQFSRQPIAQAPDRTEEITKKQVRVVICFVEGIPCEKGFVFLNPLANERCLSRGRLTIYQDQPTTLPAESLSTRRARRSMPTFTEVW